MEDRLKETGKKWLSGVNNEKTFEKEREKGGKKKSRRRRRTLLSYFGGEGGGSYSKDDVNFREEDEVGNGNELHLRDDGKCTDDNLVHHHHKTVLEGYDIGADSGNYKNELQPIEKMQNSSVVVVVNDSKKHKDAATAISMQEDDKGSSSLGLLKATKNNFKGMTQEMITEEQKGGTITMPDSSNSVVAVDNNIVREKKKSCDEICGNQSSLNTSVAPPNGVTTVGGQQTTRLAITEEKEELQRNERGRNEENNNLKLRKAADATKNEEEEYLLRHASNPFFLSVKQKKKLALFLDRQRIAADRLKTARSLASFKETHVHKNVAPLFERRIRQPLTHKSTKRKAWTLLDFPTVIDTPPPISTSEFQLLQNQPETTAAGVQRQELSLSSNLTWWRKKRQKTPPHLFQPHFDTDDFDATKAMGMVSSREQYHCTSPSVARDLFGGGGGNGDINCCLRKTWKDLTGKDSVMALGMACGLSVECYESSMSRYDEMRRLSTTDSLWTETYRPQLPSDICGNSGCVKSLLDWLDQCKGRLARRGRKQLPSHCGSAVLENETSRGRCSSEESMAWSTDDDDIIDNSKEEDDCEIPTATLLVGPVGVGKTTTVYACAVAAGFTVIEVNASCSRSGTAIRKMFGEAAQSQRLGLPSSSGNRKAPPLPDIIDMTDNNTANDVTSFGNKRRKPKHHRNTKSKGDRYTFFDGRSSSAGSSNPQSGASAADDFDNPNGIESSSSSRSSSLNVPKLTLILVEEIDVVTEEDAGFAAALKTLRADAKVPVIFTATCIVSVNYIVDRHVSVLQMEKARIWEVSHVIASIAYAERLAAVHTRACVNLAQYFNLDLRRCILALQGWGTDLMSACLAEDEGTGSICGEEGAAWLAFDSIERVTDNYFCQQLLPVASSKDMRYPRILRLDPSNVPCGGSSSHRIIVNGSGFLHPPPIQVGNNVQTATFRHAPVSIIVGHERVSCNLLSDSQIEVWIPPCSIPCGVNFFVFIGEESSNETAATLGAMTFPKRQRNWMLRSDFEVLCYKRIPERKEQQKKSSKEETTISDKISPPPKRKNRYSMDNVADVTTTKTVAVDETLNFSGVDDESPIVGVVSSYENSNDDASSQRAAELDGRLNERQQPLNNSEHSRNNNLTIKCSEDGNIGASDRTHDLEEKDNNGEGEEEFDGGLTASSSSDTTTIPPLSVISSTSNSSQQSQGNTDFKRQPCLVENTAATLEQEQVVKFPAPIKPEPYSRPTRKQIDEFRLVGGELDECWNVADSFSFSDIILTGCTPQEDGNNFRAVLPNSMHHHLHHSWDLSDAGEESCKNTTGRDYEGRRESPWPLVPSGPYIARDIWMLALKKPSSSARKDKERQFFDCNANSLIERKVMKSNVENKEGGLTVLLPYQLQSQCLLGRSLRVRRKNKASCFWNAIKRVKNRRLTYSLYLTPEDCTELLPTLYLLSNCNSVMLHRGGIQLRHNTRSQAIREIEKVEAADEGSENSSYLLHSNDVQTVQDVQFMQRMYSQEAW